MSKTGSKFAVFLFNILIALLSAAAIVFFFLSPLWKVHVTYDLKAEKLEEMLKDEMGDVDLSEVVGEGIPLKLTLTVQTTDVFSALTSSDTGKTVEKTIEANVDSIVDQLSPTLDEIAEKFIRFVAKQGVQTVVKDQIREYLQESEPTVSDKRMEELLDKAGFTDEYINQKTDSLIDAVYADGATVNSVADRATAVVEEVFEKLAESGEEVFSGAALSEENKQNIRNTISKNLAAIADEEGNLDANDLAAKLLLDLLRSAKKSDAPESQTAGALLSTDKTPGDSATSGGENEDAKEALKAEVRQYIMDGIGDNAAEGIVVALKIAAGVMCFVFFTWAWLIVKMVCKLFSKNPAVKLKLPIWLGWLPFLLLVLLPMGAVALLEANVSFIVNAMSADMLEGINRILGITQFSFASSGWVAFAAAILLIVVSIPYGILRRKLKR